jgi:formylglycine-generating enzyme required for sulfatase activity/tRNA A-37 threonylcarbamoyl transferase component Bud32
MSDEAELVQAVEGFVAKADRKALQALRAGLPHEDDMTATRYAPGAKVGPYEVIETVGSGGQGTVYRVRREGSDSDFALKTLRYPRSERARARMRREADILRRVDHPNICSLIESNLSGDAPYLVMRFLRGRSLAQEIDATGASARRAWRNGNREVLRRDASAPLDDLRTVLSLLADLAEGLHVVHADDIVHRDIKPDNVMLTSELDTARLVLFDFGYAIDDAPDGLTTTSKEAPGTPIYMAPEQLDPKRGRVDERTDVYAFGILLYETLTLRRPFDDVDRVGATTAILAGDAPRVRRLAPEIPPEIEAVVDKAMELDQQDRYRGVLDLSKDLRRWLLGEPTLARPRTAWQKLVRGVRRHPARTAVLLVVTAAASLTVIVALFAAAQIAAEGARRQAAESVSQSMQLAAQVDGLVEEAAMLAPSTLALVPKLDAWLERAEAVRRRLAELKSGGRTPAAVELPRPEPWDDETARNRMWIKDPRSAEEIERLERRLATLRKAVDPSDDTADTIEEFEDRVQELRSALSLRPEILDAAERIDRAILDVRLRREQALGAAGRVRGTDSAAWSEAAAHVRSDVRFAGFELNELSGLVPLGADPHSGLVELLHLATHDPEVALPVRDALGLVLEPGTGIVFVLCPGGETHIGAQSANAAAANYDQNAAPGEGPVQRVRLDPFLIGKFEITQSQWQRMTGINPSYFSGLDPIPGCTTDFPLHPVESISWAYLRQVLWRHALALPTEAQWEHAARAGSTGPWWCGASWPSLNGVANLADRCVRETLRQEWPTIRDELDDGRPIHGPVRDFTPNRYGLFGTLGNVREWCADRTSRYERVPMRDGDGARAESAEDLFIARGGAFDTTPEDARSAARAAMPAIYGATNFGARARFAQAPMRKVSP